MQVLRQFQRFRLLARIVRIETKHAAIDLVEDIEIAILGAVNRLRTFDFRIGRRVHDADAIGIGTQGEVPHHVILGESAPR